jgi:hypothetical protein
MTTESPTYLEAINTAASPEVQMNQNAKTLEGASVYGKRPNLSSALTWAYWGGIWGGFTITGSTLSLSGTGSPSTENYIVVARATGVISVSQTTTNWNNTSDYARVYRVTCGASVVQETFDHRFGRYGIHGRRSGITWNQQTANYTLALTDADNGVAMNSGTAKTITIDTNANVPIPIGESILLYAEGVGAVNIAAAGGVTLRSRATTSPFLNQLAGQYAIAALVKRDTNEWVLTGDII